MAIQHDVICQNPALGRVSQKWAPVLGNPAQTKDTKQPFVGEARNVCLGLLLSRHLRESYNLALADIPQTWGEGPGPGDAIQLS